MGIKIFLDVYNQVANEKLIWNQIRMRDIILIEDIYEIQHLNGDFQHVHLDHCTYRTPDMREKLMKEIQEEYECKNANKCIAFKRQYRDKNDVNGNDQKLYFALSDKYGPSKTMYIRDDKDIVLQQKCDQIHSFFLHSDDQLAIGSGLNNDSLNPKIRKRGHVQELLSRYTNLENKEIEQSPKGQKKIDYLGKQEDEDWFRKIKIFYEKQ